MNKNLIKKIALALAAVIVIFLGYVALQPSEYRIVREIEINAPAEKIFPYLNSNKLAEQWGPWMQVDPSVVMRYSGPDSGVGSRSAWKAGKQLGTGSATIVESVPNQRVGLKLEYTAPMEMDQDAEYAIRTEGAKSVVSWSVHGRNTFTGRLMCVFVNMDKMVGKFFEMGLSKLKTVVESGK